MDTLAPANGLTTTDFDSLRTVFDNRLYPLDTVAFGREPDVDSNGVVRTMANISLAEPNQKVVVWTQPAPATLKAQRGDPGALTAALIQLR